MIGIFIMLESLMMIVLASLNGLMYQKHIENEGRLSRLEAKVDGLLGLLRGRGDGDCGSEK